MKIYRLYNDCHDIGYFKTKEGVAKYIANNEEKRISDWFDDYAEFLDLIKEYEQEAISWEEYVDKLSDNCIYVKEIEIIED